MINAQQWLENQEKLNKLFLTNNRVEGKLDFSNNPELTTLFCPRNDISSFNFSKNKNLSKLICSGNKKLKFLDLSNTKIQEEGFKKQFSDESWGTPTVSTDLPKEKIKFSNLLEDKQRESQPTNWKPWIWGGAVVIGTFVLGVLATVIWFKRKLKK